MAEYGWKTRLIQKKSLMEASAPVIKKGYGHRGIRSRPAASKVVPSKEAPDPKTVWGRKKRERKIPNKLEKAINAIREQSEKDEKRAKHKKDNPQ